MGVLFVVEADSHWLEDRVNNRATFTDTIDLDWKLPRVDLCLLSSADDAITHVCLILRGQVVATLKRRVRFSDFVDVGDAVSFDELARTMPSRLYRHVQSRRVFGGVLPPKTWQSALLALKTLRPDVAGELDRIELLA